MLLTFKRQILSVLLFTLLYVVVIGIFEVHNPQDTRSSFESMSTPPAPRKKTAAVNPLRNIDLKIKNGDTLLNVLLNHGISDSESFAALETLKTKFDPKQLSIGQSLHLTYYQYPDATELHSLTIYETPQISHTIQRTHSGDFMASTFVEPTVKKTFHVIAEIHDSLFNSGIDAGIPVNILMDVIKSYSYDVDFQRDIQPGDKLHILYERYFTESGEWVRDGNITYSSLTLSNHPINYYWYEVAGVKGFYNENGFSIRKALLKTPINGARITSGFGMRKHPILGYTKQHKGIDFGAPAGTPIYAAGDGKIVKIGAEGGYGNYIRIKHNNEFDTAYAHILRFAKGITNGRHVKQGQVIAYVGSTGRSTGPHLHFELLQNNVQINPKSIKSVPQERLMGRELRRFEIVKSQISSTLASIPASTNFVQASAQSPVTTKQ